MASSRGQEQEHLSVFPHNNMVILLANLTKMTHLRSATEEEVLHLHPGDMFLVEKGLYILPAGRTLSRNDRLIIPAAGGTVGTEGVTIRMESASKILYCHSHLVFIGRGTGSGPVGKTIFWVFCRDREPSCSFSEVKTSRSYQLSISTEMREEVGIRFPRQVEDHMQLHGQQRLS